MKLAELCVTAVVRRLLPRKREQAREVEPDPARTARIRRYTALAMKERYGEHGP
jgi:hypothetical protein